MMFSDEEIKEIPETGFMRPGDEIISITEVCLSEKFYKKELGFNNEPSFLPTSSKSDLDSRSFFRDGFFPDALEQQQASFAWTEEDGNILALVSEPGFGTTGQTTFGKDLDATFKSELKEPYTSNSIFLPTGRHHTFSKTMSDQQGQQVVSSTSESFMPERSKPQGACKVDKADPRSRFHYVKYVKRHGRTVKLWECGICSREFQHQYTLMRHLPTHTDERNFHCVICGKSFRQLSTLSQHRAIHSAERPYSCEMCNKTFNRVSTLISHRKTHNFEKPYKCHMCPKGFHQKGNLRNHLFTHTNERPYRCNICFKGFNQQSNLVCHKNKAHPNDACPVSTSKVTPVNKSMPEIQPESAKLQTEQCEVSSTVGPLLPSTERPTSSKWIPKSEAWNIPKTYDSDLWNDQHIDWSINNGVIVDPIKTYHMGVAMATRQTPFALLKPDNGIPVLVKVVDTNLPGGKQMLVPATAEDFRIGGKIVIKDEPEDNPSKPEIQESPSTESNGALQIRVPVVATVVPRIKPGGRLQLTVEEPHHDYNALAADGGINVEHCTKKIESNPAIPRTSQTSSAHPLTTNANQTIGNAHSLTENAHPLTTNAHRITANAHPLTTNARQLTKNACPLTANAFPMTSSALSTTSNNIQIIEPTRLESSKAFGDSLRSGTRISSSCALPLPPPSPPLDFISMDLFEPIECIPLGPQITAVDMDQPPPSDDSDIFIGEFEESIPLSDSD